MKIILIVIGIALFFAMTVVLYCCVRVEAASEETIKNIKSAKLLSSENDSEKM